MTRLLASFISLFLLVSTGLGQDNGVRDTAKRTTVIRVLVLNFDPIVDFQNRTRLHEACDWNDPRELAKQHAADVEEASGGRIRFQIVGWRDIDEFPVKADGFAYTPQTFLECWRTKKGWHEPDLADYPKLIERYEIVPRIENDDIDETWWFGFPYSGFGESAMAGRGAFGINGPAYDAPRVPCSRPFAIMGFSFERGPAEMLHNLCHRTEATMTRIFGGWRVEELNHDWARFAANAHQSGGIAAVGTCHYPPNGVRDYDYSNKRFVESTADDWKNYPNLTGAKTRVNCETWGGPDYHRNYMKWWFARLPSAAGENSKTGRLHDWWEYVYRFHKYDKRGRRLETIDPTEERKTAEAILAIGGRVVVGGARGREEVKRAEALQSPFEILEVDIAGAKVAEADLRPLRKAFRLERLNCGGASLTDAHLALIEALPALEWLSVTNTQVTDGGLRAAAKLRSLEYFEAKNLPLTDGGLVALARHPNLRELHLTGSKITNEGLEHLRSIPKLTILSIARTSVTDEAITALGEMQLSDLDVTGTKMTDRGVARLQKLNPAIRIRR